MLLLEDVEPLLKQLAALGVKAALHQIEVSDQDITNQANERAIAYAEDRAAELVGMRYNADGDLVENDRPGWSIDEATRELIRSDVTTAEEEGWSNDRLAAALEQNYAFSEARAETIARTETAFADVAGNLAGWTESGQVAGKEWILSENACDECEPLAGVVVELDEEFPHDGGDGPPRHPNCRCDVLPVLTEDDQEN